MWVTGSLKCTFKSTLTTSGGTSGTPRATMLGKDVPRVKARPETVTAWMTSVMVIVGQVPVLRVMWVMQMPQVMRAMMVMQAMRTIVNK